MDARGHSEVLFLLQLVGTALSQDAARSASVAVCNELAVRFDLERVSLGFVRGGSVHVEAISHNTSLDRKQQLARDLASAMEEATDQDRAVASPAAGTPRAAITRSHECLRARHGAGYALTVPLARGGEIVGAITVEGRAGAELGESGVALMEHVGAVLGPLLALTRHASSGLGVRARRWWRERVSSRFGPEHPGARIAAASLVVVLSLATFTPVSHRVRAEARVEGRTHRAVVAGIDGFVAEAIARAGDTVKAGETLGRLDERELLLEREKSVAAISKLENERRQAMAEHDRAQVRIAAAKLAQARAQLALIEDRAARTRLVAPFDGIVVRGDLSRAVGSPVERGEVLFEVAPADGHKVILQIDERDLAYVAEGASGELTLTARPGERIAFVVERITPVAVSEEGHTFFRAEARLDLPPEALRPGMAGIAKVSGGRKPLVWIWSHDLVDWLRLRAWALWA